VRAIALVQTTYTNPARTTNMADLFTALERPVIVSLLHSTIRCDWLKRAAAANEASTANDPVEAT
jgi:hypothetical protein